jgi:quaternary ammonium compound-resistance protein SugE
LSPWFYVPASLSNDVDASGILPNKSLERTPASAALSSIVRPRGHVARTRQNYEKPRIPMTATITPNLAWLLLVAAGLLEIVWAISMKASDGFTRSHFASITLVAAALSFWLLGLSLRQLPVGTAYAVWTGIGAIGAAILGAVFFGEALTLARIVCIILIVLGIVGLKLFGSAGAHA